MILFIFAPNIIKIIGPKATLGRAFKITKNGSNILEKVGYS